MATGDTLPFNTVYRDRRVTWPIQDLPFTFVFFCHYDPIHNDKDDPDLAFLPEGTPPPEIEKEFNLSTTGTEDALLNGAIIESLAEAFDRDGQPAADAGELSPLRRSATGTACSATTRTKSAVRIDGNRLGGAGENIVYLRPHFEGDRVLPEATIEVWVSKENVPHAVRPWELHSDPLKLHSDPLTVSYAPRIMEGGRGHERQPPPSSPPASPGPRSRLGIRPGHTARVLLWMLVAFLLWEPVSDWVEGEDSYDKSALKEWLDESRTFRKTLPEMAAD